MDGREWYERGLRDGAAKGDETAWKTLYDGAFDGLYTYVYYRTGQNSDVTEEIVQETWMVAVRRIAVFDPARASFQTWLRGVADKILANHWRKYRRRATHRDSAQSGQNPTDRPSNRAAALADHIQAAMTALPNHYRAVLRERYRDGRSVAQIADASNRTPKSVESLLTRARNAFRSAYRQLEDEPNSGDR